MPKHLLGVSLTTDYTETSRSVINSRTERTFFTSHVPWSVAVFCGQSWPLLCSKYRSAESPLKEEIIHPISSQNQSITALFSPGILKLVFIAYHLTEELVWAALGEKRAVGRHNEGPSLRGAATHFFTLSGIFHSVTHFVTSKTLYSFKQAEVWHKIAEKPICKEMRLNGRWI